MADNFIPQDTIAGNVGQNPKTFENSKGTVTKFSVATVDGYDKDAKEERTVWVDVTVWDENLQAVVNSSKGIKKGNRVVILGRRSTYTDKNGVERQNMNAQRIGLVDYLRPTKAAEKPAPDEGSELGW